MMTDIPARVAPYLRIEQDLAGKVACVTGASRGIGKAIAINLASRGCSVLATCSSPDSLSEIENLKGDVNALYRSNPDLKLPKVAGIVANVLESNFATAIAEGIAQHFQSTINIYVNSATHLGATDVGNIKTEDIQMHMIGSIQTPILTIEELVRRKMFQKESRIVYISSVAARSNPGFNLLYNVTKSAAESLVRTWSNLYGGRDQSFAFMSGTTANSVCVGLTETHATTQFGPEMFQKFQDEHTRDQALPRVAQPEDIADVVGLLCGKESRWITGSVVSADGGGMFIL